MPFFKAGFVPKDMVKVYTTVTPRSLIAAKTEKKG